MRLIKVLERILIMIPIIIGVAVIVFLFMRLMPGDPVDIMMGQGGAVSAGEMEQLRAEFNLDKPLHIQLGIFLGGLVRGDLGNSYVQKRPVVDLIAGRLPATIELAVGGLIVSLLIAIPIGIISAVRQNSWLDRLSMAGAFLGISMPSFWLGIVLLLLFAVHFQWLPVQGRLHHAVSLQEVTGFFVLDSLLTRNYTALASSLRHLILPSITLGAPMAAVVARVLRSSMLETLRSDYVTLARAKGAPESGVVLRHALRNALIPTITVVGLQVGVLLGGNMIVETVFGWPGLGRTVVSAIFDRDFPLVQGAVMIYAFIYIVTNLIVDITYTYLNPRIQL
ncbi:MAG: ABC transporter permease [Anaerolineaceae bacterium]|nr:ABC transporter permease [Anaerolineaceae bacterium]